MREDQVGLYDFSSSWFDPGQWIEEAILDPELSKSCFYFLTCHRLAKRGCCFKKTSRCEPGVETKSKQQISVDIIVQERY